MTKRYCTRFSTFAAWPVIALLFSTTSSFAGVAEEDSTAKRIIRADVVALDQAIWANRLGAHMPEGMMFALRGDVVPMDCPVDANGNDEMSDAACNTPLQAGAVRLRSYKRPRPLVLRANVGDELRISFTNLLSPTGFTGQPANLRDVAFHVVGLELLGSIASDGSWVGQNASSLASPGKTHAYRYFASAEGVFYAYSQANLPFTGLIGNGLFGSVNVQPEGAQWYRSQVTRDQFDAATITCTTLKPGTTRSRFERAQSNEDGSHPCDRLPENMALFKKVIEEPSHPKYGEQMVSVQNEPLWTLVTYIPSRSNAQTIKRAVVVMMDDVARRSDAGQAASQANFVRLYTAETHHPIVDYYARSGGEPVLAMLKSDGDNHQIVHSDLTAIITGPDAGRFPYSNLSPSFRANPASPDRRQPYREFTINYMTFPNTQAFPQYTDQPGLGDMLPAGGDLFGINYGMAGIGSEILANRLGVGPMGNKDAVDLKYEEFFLSSWSVGDPAMIVDYPANIAGKKATKA